MSGLARNRWFILACAAVDNLLVGALYIWSIFNLPLMEQHSWTMTEVSVAYSLYAVMECVGSIVSGALRTKFPTNRIMQFGGVLFVGGWFCAGFANSLPLLYLTYGILGGLGSGFTYNSVVSVVTSWFPDKRGLANGICLGSIGIAPLIFAPIGNLFIEHFSVGMSFHLVGVLFGVCLFSTCWALVLAPAGWMPEGANTANASVISGPNRVIQEVDTPRMLRQPIFYVLFLVFLIAGVAGNSITSHTSDIGQELAHISAAQGAWQIGILAVANCSGRLVNGALSDRLGRYPVLIGVTLITALDMIFLFTAIDGFQNYMAALCILGFCFGGITVIVPSLTADLFGQEHFSQNYSIVFAGFTLSCIVGPLLASQAFMMAGSFIPSFYISGFMNVAGIGLIVLLWVMANRIGARSLATDEESFESLEASSDLKEGL